MLHVYVLSTQTHVQEKQPMSLCQGALEGCGGMLVASSCAKGSGLLRPIILIGSSELRASNNARIYLRVSTRIINCQATDTL